MLISGWGFFACWTWIEARVKVSTKFFETQDLRAIATIEASRHGVWPSLTGLENCIPVIESRVVKSELSSTFGEPQQHLYEI